MKRALVPSLLILAMTLFTFQSAHAGDLTIPNTFTAGTPAVAAEVNGNFSAVETEVDDNAADIANNTADISTNQTDIADNTSDIADLTTRTGVRLTRINASAVQGIIAPTSSSVFADICTLGTFTKDQDTSIIELIYTGHAEIDTDGTYQSATLKFQLINTVTTATYSATRGSVYRKRSDIGPHYRTINMHSLIESVPAGTYEVHIIGKGTVEDIYINPGNFDAYCYVKELAAN